MLGKGAPRCHSDGVTLPADEPRSPLDIPDYRRFWLARFLSVFATTGMVVVLGYQLYDVARSQYGMSIGTAAFQLGLLGLAQFLPVLLLTPLAGLIADRYDRRIVAGSAVGIDMVVALVLMLATIAGHLNLPLLFALGALHGTARVFIGPAMASIAPNVVPVRLMPRAVAINSMAWQTGSVGGPAIAGLLFAQLPALPYAISAVLLALATLSVFRIRPLPPPEENKRAHPLSQIVGGLTFVWHDRFLFGCVTLDLFAVLLGGATALLPVYAKDIFHIDALGLGILTCMPAVGALACTLVIARTGVGGRCGFKMFASVAIFGVATIGFGLSTNVWVGGFFLIVAGAVDMVSVQIRQMLVQLETPDEMRGRVSAVNSIFIGASNELGAFESGAVAALTGPVAAVVLGGVGSIAIAGIWAKLFPELRDRDRLM